MSFSGEALLGLCCLAKYFCVMIRFVMTRVEIGEFYLFFQQPHNAKRNIKISFYFIISNFRAIKLQKLF